MVSFEMWCPSDWETPRKPSQLQGTTGRSSSFDIVLATALMSSPMRPTGHSDRTEMPFASGKSSFVSRSSCASFLSPP